MSEGEWVHGLVWHNTPGKYYTVKKCLCDRVLKKWLTFSYPRSQNATLDLQLRALARLFHTPLTQNVIIYFGPPTSSSGARLFRTPLSQNATVNLQLQALARDFFAPISVRMLLLTSNFEFWRATFSYPSQSECYFGPPTSSSGATFSHPSHSECYFGPPTSSSGARLFHTPLNQNDTSESSSDLQLRALAQLFQTPLSQNATLDLQLRALAHDFFTPLSVRMLLWTSNFDLWRMTFSHPSESECYFLTGHM